MNRNAIQELEDFGQSVWLDNLSRSLIETGALKRLIDQGLLGMTSNPTIFDKAIAAGGDYDARIARLCRPVRPPLAVYDDLTTDDVRDAADVFRPVFERTSGRDGYVSLEINPKLADKAGATIEEGRRLHRKVGRPNVMFKVPATPAGFEAIEELTAEGINVNVTLIFSVGQYEQAARSYLRGLRRLERSGAPLAPVRSVASVFVSRIDSDVDALLDERISAEKGAAGKALAARWKGRAAVANSILCYGKYGQIFSAQEFADLERKGAWRQRPLWGSTSTKNPAYSDIKYVVELMARDTVNTMPEATFAAFLDHGRVGSPPPPDFTAAAAIIRDLGDLGIDIDSVCARLLEKGVRAFDQSLDHLLATIEKKSAALCGGGAGSPDPEKPS